MENHPLVVDIIKSLAWPFSILVIAIALILKRSLGKLIENVSGIEIGPNWLKIKSRQDADNEEDKT